MTNSIELAAARVRRELEKIHARVSGDVRDLQALSEKEILSIGNVLSTIVDRVDGIVADSRAQLRESTNSVEALTETFLAEVEKESAAQQGAVDKVVAITDDMGRSIESIDYLRQSTEMLAINSLIEAARLGEQGKSFGVLAAQMRDLAKSVKETTSSVNESIEGVRRDLPSIAEHNAAMQAHMQSYIEDIKAQLQKQQVLDAQSGDGSSLDEVVELTNRALSHLQFQDPLVQRLGAIEREVGAMAERLDAVLHDEQTAEIQPEAGDPEVGDGPASGNIMFF